MDGIPLLGNSHMRQVAAAPCGCGGFPGVAPGGSSPRQHHFWFCPVAQAVVDQLAVRVGGGLVRAQVWLLQSPQGVQQCVWDVVVLAAISAMEVGRQFMAAALKNPAGGVMAGSALRDRAIQRVVADFWVRLRTFAALGVPRSGWEAVGPHHPWLRVVAGCLVCVSPDVDDPGSE